MKSFSVTQIMHLKTQKPGFFIDRPSGTPFYIFLHFINPVTIRLRNKTIHTAPNACIIYSPNFPQYYSASSLPLFHNYFHFYTDDSLFVEKYSLPLNSIFYTDKQNEITDLIEETQIYFMLNNDNFEKRTEDFELSISATIEKLFKVLSDEKANSKTSGLFSKESSFYALRQLIYSQPNKWSIEAMCKYVNLSRSYFFLMYKKFFSVSPNEDLLNASISLAETFLLSSDMNINEIAEKCGFNSTDYFIQVFKKYKGTTPLQFKKNHNSIS